MYCLHSRLVQLAKADADSRASNPEPYASNQAHDGGGGRDEAPELALRHRIRRAVGAGDVAEAQRLLAASRFAALLQPAPPPAPPAPASGPRAGGPPSGVLAARRSGGGSPGGTPPGDPAANGLFSLGGSGGDGRGASSAAAQMLHQVPLRPVASGSTWRRRRRPTPSPLATQA